MRQNLPNRRFSINRTIEHERHTYEVTIGVYPDEFRPGEVFVQCTKIGSHVEALGRDAAVLLSLALQHGIPIDLLRKTLQRTVSGSPQTIIGVIADEIAKWMPPAAAGAVTPRTPVLTGGCDKVLA